MVEFEPVMRRELEQGALRSLGIGGPASLALVAGALCLRRFNLGEERLRAVVERDGRLAALSEMAAVLAHNIRNPLGSMKGYAQLLAEPRPPDTPKRRKADRVVDKDKRLEKLSVDLLSFVRPKQIERQGVYPKEVLAAAAEKVDGNCIVPATDGVPQPGPSTPP